MQHLMTAVVSTGSQYIRGTSFTFIYTLKVKDEKVPRNWLLMVYMIPRVARR